MGTTLAAMLKSAKRKSSGWPGLVAQRAGYGNGAAEGLEHSVERDWARRFCGPRQLQTFTAFRYAHSRCSVFLVSIFLRHIAAFVYPTHCRVFQHNPGELIDWRFIRFHIEKVERVRKDGSDGGAVEIQGEAT